MKKIKGKKAPMTPEVKSRPKTRMAIVLDCSGSMAKTKEQALMGLNEQVQHAKELAKDHDLRCCFVTFNAEVFEHLWDAPAETLKEAKSEEYRTCGGTSVRDAVGYTLRKMLDTAKEDDNETAYLINIISDGETLNDMHYKPRYLQNGTLYDPLRELIQGCESSGRFTITWMGCSPEYMYKIADMTGTTPSNMAAWSNSSDSGTKQAFQNQNRRMKKYFAERAMGQMASPSYQNDQVGVCADFTKDVGESAPAPVLNTVNTNINFGELLIKMPQYSNVYPDGHQTVCSTGSLFGNTIGVKWTNEMSADLASQHLLNPKG
jgi:hypothetical protein